MDKVKGDPWGSFATCVQEIDSMLGATWGRIYARNLDNVHKAAATFVAKSTDRVFKMPEMQCNHVTAQ